MHSPFVAFVARAAPVHDWLQPPARGDRVKLDGRGSFTGASGRIAAVQGSCMIMGGGRTVDGARHGVGDASGHPAEQLLDHVLLRARRLLERGERGADERLYEGFLVIIPETVPVYMDNSYMGST